MPPRQKKKEKEKPQQLVQQNPSDRAELERKAHELRQEIEHALEIMRNFQAEVSAAETTLIIDLLIKLDLPFVSSYLEILYQAFGIDKIHILLTANITSCTLGLFFIYIPPFRSLVSGSAHQSPVPIGNTPLELMPLKPLESYVNQLTTHYPTMREKGRKYKTYSNRLPLLILIYVAIAYSYNPETEYFHSLLAFSGVLFVALNNALSSAYRETREWNDRRLLASRLAAQDEQLKRLLDGKSCHITKHDTNRLKTSSFTINFNKNNLKLSPKRLKRIVRRTLLRFGAKITGEDKTRITIAAGNQLDQEQADKRQQYLRDYIERVFQLATLKNQLERIDGCIIVPSYDEDGLPIITADFVVLQNAAEVFENIFPTLEFAQSTPDEKDNVAISLRGYEPGNEGSLRNWLQQQKTASTITADLPDPAPVSTTASTPASIAVPFTTTPEEKKPKRWHSSTPLQAQTPVQKGQTISWELPENHTVIYDPEKGDEQEVRPIQGLVGQFGIFAVPRNRVSRNRNDDGVYKKFHGQFSERLKAVTSEGQQGVKICGKEEDGSAKLKVLGDYGAWRVFAHAVRSPTGQTLHVFDDVRLVHT